MCRSIELQSVAKLPARSRKRDAPMKKEAKHPLQRLMDNPWWLLVLGLLIPILSYTVWGWIELALMPPAQLP